MYQTAMSSNHEIAEKICQHTQRLLEQVQAIQADDLLKAHVSAPDIFDNLAVNCREIENAVHDLFAGSQQMENEERFLWFVHFELHGENRIWWAYFRDWLEVHACFTRIVHAFPCFKLKSLEACPYGLQICSASYASTSSRQQHVDALQPEAVHQRDKQIFPLAPFACDYLASFTKGLGDAVPCARCQADAPLSPTNTTLAP